MQVSCWDWYGLSFRAMNTRVEVQLYTDLGSHEAGELIAGVQHMFGKAEKHLSRFDPASELSQLNRSRGQPRRVSSLLFDIVEAALLAASATGGLFDPSLLKAMQAIGYDRSFERICQDVATCGREERHSPASFEACRGQYQAIVLDRSRREVCLPADVQLDLGGIGKGWTVDRASDWLAGNGPFILNAGGDLYAYGAPPGEAGWLIAVEDPRQPERDVAHLTVNQRAVATSTTCRRQWQQGGKMVHHLIDPRTGEPANTDAVSVTVVAHRVALAEICAKVALILGVEAGRVLLESIPQVEGLFIRSDGGLVSTGGFSSYSHEVI